MIQQDLLVQLVETEIYDIKVEVVGGVQQDMLRMQDFLQLLFLLSFYAVLLTLFDLMMIMMILYFG